MKRIVLLLSCVLLSTQLVADDSFNTCKKHHRMLETFDPEWEEECSCPTCRDDTSEFADPFNYE